MTEVLDEEAVLEEIIGDAPARLQAAGDLILAAALPNVPKKSGALAASGYVAVDETTNTVRVGFTDYKAFWWEFGHVNRFTRRFEPPRAFLRGALAANQDKVEAILAGDE